MFLKILKKLLVWFKKNFFSLIILLYILYSFVTIYETSFVMNGVRYFISSDDVMISMRYGYNFAHGQGMVWNQGEFVEGFTNPLWTFFMSLVNFLPIPAEKISIIIQITEVFCIIISLYFIKRIAALISKSSSFVIFFSVIFTAFYFPLVNWTLVQGMEVGILTLFLSSATFYALKSIQNKKFSRILFIILGLGVLTRIDFIVSAIIISLFLIIFDKNNRKKILFIGLPIVLISFLGQTIFRFFYYHDLLPNTYYVKVSGYPTVNRIIRGIYVLLKSFSPNIAAMYNNQILQLFARIIVICMITIPFVYAGLKKNKYIFLLLTLFAAQLTYSVYVGGDVWEYYGGANRFIAYVIPLFFISLIFTTHSLFEKIKTNKTYFKVIKQIVKILIMCLFFFLLNRTNAEQLPRLFFKMSPTTYDVNILRLKQANCLNSITKPHAKIAIAAAGLIPYFNLDRYFIDILGKTEKTIARMPAINDNRSKNIFKESLLFQPGHMKWNYPYLIKTYKPDVFGDFYQREYQHNEKYLFTHGYMKMKTTNNCGDFYVLKNSSKINFSKLKDY
jgi:arabinofuranosyltransferase